MEQPEEYTLTEEEQALILPIVQTVEELQTEARTILRAISRVRKLDGNWTLQGNRLIKVNGNGNG